MSSPEQRRLVVEIGGGRKSFTTSTRSGRRMLRQNEDVVIIDTFDNDPKRFREAQSILTAYESLNGLPPQRTVHQCSANDMPFKDRTVNEVVAINFFGDHRTPPIHDEVAQEIARVLRRDGLVTVVETYTPDRIPLDTLRALMGRVGLRQLNEGEEHNPTKIVQYADLPGRRQYGDYHAAFGFPVERPEPTSDPDRSIGPITGTGLIARVGAQVLEAIKTAHEGVAAARRGQEKILDAHHQLGETLRGSGTADSAVDNPLVGLVGAGEKIDDAAGSVHTAVDEYLNWMRQAAGLNTSSEG
jgi:SAM-dependent methyltransferase